LNVLYVNHTSHISGGERSLLTMLGGLPDEVQATVACPPGALADALREQGVRWLSIPSVDGSLKLHPLHTPRALASMARAALRVRRHARSVGAELLHANSIRASLIALAAGRLGAPPTVAHIRDCLPPGRVSGVTRRLICSRSAVVLANSRYTAESFRVPGIATAMAVAHSPIDLVRFDPDRVDRDAARAGLALDDSTVALGVVAQLTPWKGQEDAVRALALLRREVPNVRLLLAGSAKFVARATRFDNPTYVRRLHELVRELKLEEEVVFLGEREDVPELMRALDVLLVPSWEEPFGRTVVEGMAMGMPVAATAVGGPSEIIRPGEGLLLPPREPQAWAEALRPLVEDPRRREAMGARGRESSGRFAVAQHVQAVLGAYAQTGVPAAQADRRH
jgi:glycosyltransferase involved in cell wall biosynthesis